MPTPLPVRSARSEWAFCFLYMKLQFNKPPLSYKEQVEQLKTRGLIIDDELIALHLLENLSYFRLSGYWYPLLQDKTNHIFKPGSQLSTAFALYCFDRELRNLVLKEVEKIEIAVRAKMIYILSHSHGAFWFENPVIFSDQQTHSKSVLNMKQDYSNSDEQFIKAFKNKYSNPLPPSWMMMEITSFGTLSRLYKNLKPGHAKRTIAHYFGIDDKTFESWLHSLVYLRNVCAHHARLWNRVMSIQPRFPSSPKKQWLTNNSAPNNRTYYILSMILFFLQTVNLYHTFLNKFHLLLAKYPNIDLKSMGFDINYNNEPLWKLP